MTCCDSSGNTDVGTAPAQGARAGSPLHRTLQTESTPRQRGSCSLSKASARSQSPLSLPHEKNNAESAPKQEPLCSGICCRGHTGFARMIWALSFFFSTRRTGLRARLSRVSDTCKLYDTQMDSIDQCGLQGETAEPQLLKHKKSAHQHQFFWRDDFKNTFV